MMCNTLQWRSGGTSMVVCCVGILEEAKTSKELISVVDFSHKMEYLTDANNGWDTQTTCLATYAG